MLSELRHLLDATAAWLDAECGILMSRATHAAARIAILISAGIVGALAICGLLAGAGVLIAQALGPAAGVLISSDIALLGAGITAWCALNSLKKLKPASEAVAKEAAARERLKELLPGGDDADQRPSSGKSESSGEILGEIGQALLGSLLKPGLFTGSVFAIVSVLGLKRSARMAQTVASVVGSAAAVAKAIRMTDSLAEHITQNGTAPSRDKHTSLKPESRVPAP